MRRRRGSAPAARGPVEVPTAPSGSFRRIFVRCLVIALVPVVVLAVIFAVDLGWLPLQRVLAQGRSQAVLFAATSVEPILDGRPLSRGLSTVEQAELLRIATVGEKHAGVSYRLLDLGGHVAFSSAGAARYTPSPGVAEAAGGTTIGHRAQLSSPVKPGTAAAPQAVEVDTPLEAGPLGRRVGVLEVYLPYAPLLADVTSGRLTLILDLTGELLLIYLALIVIVALVSRRLRSHVAWNAFLAEHDTLTGLPNRALFHRRAEAALRECSSTHPVAIALVDLDRFKVVNDTLGHQNGDALLVELGRRLTAETRDGTTIARLGGDEFGFILASESGNAAEAERALRRLRDVIGREASVSGLPLSVEASIGFVLAPDDGVNVDELVQRADIAMYVAKEQQAGVLRYQAAQDHYDTTNLRLVVELRHAIQAKELVLHYQPKVRLSDGEVTAVEALVRWNHPVEGLLSPRSFLPLAEQTDVIFDLTRWVLDTAIEALAGFPPDIDLAVNVSARNLSAADFGDEVIAALARHRMPARRLVLEVTETALLSDPGRAIAMLTRLDDRGVRVSIDDFGSGQASLGYLSTLPIHELKIDRGFVSGILGNPKHAAIVRSIVDLGHNLSLRVVGEGVENSSVLEGLRQAGCDEAQGFLIAEPMPVEELLDWLHTTTDVASEA
ncbi:MAG: Diguanylate cyclase/phosphodiesterase [Acidimicrobiaceae bacterium]|nr:Diguanylate cyclase/phosphodiesterase [Acidimicrobiaceae bacterium]